MLECFMCSKAWPICSVGAARESVTVPDMSLHVLS